jgi:hypothetical protein
LPPTAFRTPTVPAVAPPAIATSASVDSPPAGRNPLAKVRHLNPNFDGSDRHRRHEQRRTASGIGRQCSPRRSRVCYRPPLSVEREQNIRSRHRQVVSISHFDDDRNGGPLLDDVDAVLTLDHDNSKGRHVLRTCGEHRLRDKCQKDNDPDKQTARPTPGRARAHTYPPNDCDTVRVAEPPLPEIVMTPVLLSAPGPVLGSTS